MRPYQHIRGVPAAGHISGGYWHPGSINGCPKGQCAPRRPTEAEVLRKLGDRTLSLRQLTNELPGVHFGQVAHMLNRGLLTGDLDALSRAK